MVCFYNKKERETGESSMRKIIVTEENFESILSKLQKTCNKYKMFEFDRVFTEDMVEEKQYRRNSIGIRDEVKHIKDELGNLEDLKIVKRFFANSKYVRVTKHLFREEFEQGKDSYNAKYCYPKMKSLIHLDLSGGRAEVISVGDKVQFFPFGGFVIWTDNDFTRFESPLKIYKNIYFPDFIKGKILNLDEENSIRDKEIEKENELWDRLMEDEIE